jgi:hypothetical protein
MKKMVAFFLVESLFGSRKRVDWPLVLAWAGIAIALWLLLAVR